ncbi:MAG: sugar phosphate isomerase/epimerase [Verrucomicrobiota bacterium]|nr:sugar phosphate isomerase/epimerase [Verrucomicrobiota bacterium]
MKKEQIAVTMFTLRDFCKNEEEYADSLKKVSKIGYENIQISGVKVETKKIKEIADAFNLNICATHEPAADILGKPQEVVERLNVLDCKHTAFPNVAKYPIKTKKDVVDLARKLDKSGEILKRNGKILSYHNHEYEFARIEGKTILETIFENTDSEHLKAELDTHWVQRGGANPTTWCKLMRKRLPLLHLKDYIVTTDRETLFGEIGSGNLEWYSIIEEARRSECEWYIVEQDHSLIDPFESIKMSYNFLVENFAS